MNKIRVFILLSLVLIITFVAFSPCLKNGFVNWDDEVYVIDNYSIRHFSLANIKKIFSSFFGSNYQPITILSYLFEYQAAKLNPLVYHLTNIIFHLLNTGLVFWLIYLFAKRFFVALLTAVLFGIHPLHVESVAWISERKDVLYTFFYLLAMISYFYYLTKNRKMKFYYFVVIAFILSLLSKAMAITLPVVLLLTDYFFYGKCDKKVYSEKIPLFIISFVFGVIALIGQYISGAVRNESLANLVNKLVIASYSIVFYLSKIIFPVRLSCIYPYTLEKSGFLYVYPLIFLSILMTVIILSGKFTRKIIFGSGFFLITILPVLQFVPIGRTIVADRYVYISSIGIFYLISEGLLWLYNQKSKHVFFLKRLILLLLISVMLTLTVLTWKRCQIWKDSIVLWSEVINKYPNVALAYNNRGSLLHEKKEYVRAYQDFEKAIFYDQKLVGPYLNLGNLYRDMGKINEAISVFDKLIVTNQGSADAYFNMGNLYYELGRKDLAMSSYEKTVKINEKHVFAYYYLGILYDEFNRKEEAVKMFKKSLVIDPHYLLSYIALSRIYDELNKAQDKAVLYKKAITDMLDYYDAYRYIGNLYRDGGKDKEAIALYKRAMQINPELIETYINLSGSYCAVGKYKQAIVILKRALELNPSYAGAHNNIALAYYYAKNFDLAVKHCNKAVELGYKVNQEFLEMIKQRRE